MSEHQHGVRIDTPNGPVAWIDRFAFAHGEITFLLGESGIGKSLLSKAVYGLLEEDGIKVTVDGQPYAGHLQSPKTRAIQASSFFVFQEPSSHLNPLMKISAQLGEGKLAACEKRDAILADLWQTDDARPLRKVTEIFPKPFRPSGGEKQRVLLAMAFQKIDMLKTADDTLFVFDEPTGSLDDAHRNAFLRLLFARYSQKPFTILIITHDYSIISEVERSHRELVNRIHFRELQRVDNAKVELRDFSSRAYLDWLKEKNKLSRLQPSPASQALLSVDSQLDIFGRTLRVYEDALHCRPCDLEIRPGEMVYLKAASGAGKTTLAKSVMGLLKPRRMRASLAGIHLTQKTKASVWEKEIWGRAACMVFQHADESLNLKATVTETFAGLPGSKNATANSLRAHLCQLFPESSVDGLLEKPVEQLSGGQKQRLNLLRALFLNPKLIILDEPLNGLDFESIRKVLHLLEKKRESGTALLLISHNEEIFQSLVPAECIRYLK